jgi:excisionase family DNA binding protein
MSEPLLLSIREAAKAAGIGRDAMYEFVRSGRVRSVRVGSKRLVPRPEIRAWVEREIEGGEQHHGTALT